MFDRNLIFINFTCDLKLIEWQKMEKKAQKVYYTIVIPLKEPGEDLHESLKHCFAIDYPLYEIIVLPDTEAELPVSANNVRVIPTGPVPPSKKRDLAISHAHGNILAFIDDDAYPRSDWLKNAAPYFENEIVAGVGGPAVTPRNDTVWQRASGHILSSWIGSGPHSYRYTPKRMREVDDYPTCNLLVRKSVLERLGGFDTKYWPGEDTKLCLEITKQLGMKILYVPDVLVYHHRRPVFRPHLRQIWNYSVHRGFFAKKFSETSLRFSYFLPSILVAGFILGSLLTVFIPQLGNFLILVVATYIGLNLISVLRTKDLKAMILVFLGVILTHVCYGVGFPRGLLTKELKR